MHAGFGTRWSSMVVAAFALLSVASLCLPIVAIVGWADVEEDLATSECLGSNVFGSSPQRSPWTAVVVAFLAGGLLNIQSVFALPGL
mmetsp:Transcript_12705/g.30398  ORF Transcript_12705/g.30398 Transcript_12705/m.30398 type:complete len:87 (+) Transcript_12705:173-433(+)